MKTDRHDRRHVLRLLSGLAVVGMTACGAPSSLPSGDAASGVGEGASAAPSALPSGMGSTAGDGAFPRTVAHFRGKTTITTAPRRVVVLSTGQFDDVLSLGIVPVGTTSAVKADLVPDYLVKAFPRQGSQISATKSVGTRKAPDVEAIANLGPDLILVNDTLENDSLYEALAKVAPTVVTEGTGVNWKQDLLLIGSALGKQDLAMTRLRQYADRAKSLGRAVDAATTVSFLRHQSDRVRIWGTASFVGSIVQDAGLARPETQRFAKTSQDISSEQLDQADGDWLFYGTQDGDASALRTAPLWESLGAVTRKQAVQVDDEMFYLNAGLAAANGVLDVLESRLG